MNSALVVVDVQRGLVDAFESDWATALPVIRSLIARAHDRGVPVVFVQHCGAAPTHPLHPQSSGWALHPSLDVRDGDLRVEKTWSDAFRDTELDDALRARGVDELIVTGTQTEYCVDTTVRRALSLGYNVQLVADGHTTSENGLLSREQIVAHHNQTLATLATGSSVIEVLPASGIRLD